MIPWCGPIVKMNGLLNVIGTLSFMGYILPLTFQCYMSGSSSSNTGFSDVDSLLDLGPITHSQEHYTPFNDIVFSPRVRYDV